MQRPPLPARLRPAHWMALDAVLAAVYLGLLAGWVLPRVPHGHLAHAAGLPGLPAWLDWVSAVSISIPLAARRKYPLAAFAVVLAGTVASELCGLRQVPLPALAYVLFWIALTRSGRSAAGPLVLAEVGIAAVFAAIASPGALSPAGSGAALPALLLTMLTQAAAWLIGRTVRQQRAYTRGLARQAARQAQDEIDAAHAAVTGQRLQIARELHDVVAHSVSLMTVQAGAARMLADTRPDQAWQLLGTIETTGRDCLRETRRVLGALREDDRAAHADGPHQVTAESLSPAPGLRELPRLVAHSAHAGVTVVVQTAGQPRDLPSTMDLSAYRIIQEAVTNVIRHSTASRCQVSLAYRPGELSIEVTDPGRGPRVPPAEPPVPAAVGHGLIGMRERVILHDGLFSAAPLPEGGFRVSVTLPLREQAA